MSFLLYFVALYVVLFLVTLIPSLVPLSNRARKEGIQKTWQRVGGPTFAFGIIVIPAIIALILASIESIFGSVPSFILGGIAIFNATVFWQWAKTENRPN